MALADPPRRFLWALGRVGPRTISRFSACRDGATGGSTGRDRRIGGARQTDRLGATTSPIDGRSSNLLGRGATGSDGSRSWMEAAMVVHSGLGDCRWVPARCGPPPPLTAQTEASGPAVPRSRHPDVHAPTFRARARVTILPSRTWHACHRVSRRGWRHLVTGAATVRATFPVCSFAAVGRAGPEWTGRMAPVRFGNRDDATA